MTTIETTVIPFTYNWNNKLDCRALTTIRIYNPQKHFVGNRLSIELKGESKGQGHIMAIKTFYLSSLNPFISYLDTGYSVEECEKIIRTMYPKVNFAITQLALILIVKDK